jgi:hypothetical protein
MNIRLRFVLRKGLWPVVIGVAALTLIAAPPTAAAVFTDGSASVWAYMRDDSVDHTLVIPTLSFTVGDLGMKALRFEGSARGYTDIRGGKSEQRELRILRGVFVYAPEKKSYELRIGQQWLTEGVGRGNLAGLWARYRFDKRSAITVYGGSRIAESISLQETNRYQGYAVGFQARTHLQPFNVGASYYYLGRDGDLLYHAAGLEANGRVSRCLAVRGRFEMNVEQAAVERAQFLADWRARSNVQVTGEFRAQAPRVFEDSYFTIFLSEATTAYGRANVRWEFHKPLYARFSGTMLFSEYPDPLYKAQLALGCSHIEVGYTHWLSVTKGVMDGVFAQAHFRFRDRYDAFGGYDWSRGSNADSDLKPTTNSYAAYLGGSADICKTFSVTARAEQVRGVEYKNDWRGLLGITARFSNLR